MTQQPDQPTRFQALDSLRGLAALSVVFYHCLIANPAVWAAYQVTERGGGPAGISGWVKVLAFTPLHILWDGPEAVMIFFALSGFALMQSFLRPDPPCYSAFVVKRICRIYPTCWACLLVSIAAMMLIGHAPPPNVSSPIASNWSKPLSVPVILGYVFLLGGHAELDNVIWSLWHEMRISLFFPQIARSVLRHPVKVLLGWWLLVYLLCIAMRRLTGGVFTETFDYAFLFVCGAMVARHRLAVSDWFTSLNVPSKWAISILTIVLYNARWELGLLPARGPHPEITAALVRTGALLILVLVIVSPNLTSCLKHPYLLYLGRISYSLYLVHMVVLTGLFFTLGWFSPWWVVAATTIFISIPCAHILNRLVERPSIRLGRHLSTRIDIRRRTFALDPGIRPETSS